MEGREERKEIIETRLEMKAKNQPEVIKKYLTYLDRKTHNTKKTYLDNAIRYVSYLREKGYDVDDKGIYKMICKGDVIDYLASIRYTEKDGKRVELAPSTQNVILAGVTSFFDCLEAYGYIEEGRNPCNKIDKVRETVSIDPVYLTPAEIRQGKLNIVNGVGSKKAITRHQKWIERDMCLVMMGLYTGLRVSALIEINVQDINLEEKYIRVTEKENFTRDIDINDELVRLIKEWLPKREILLYGAECDALFISCRRKRMTRDAVDDVVRKYLGSATDKHITPHKMRSTFITNIVDQTGDIYLGASLAGHANVQNTRRYAGVSERKKRNAVESLAELY